MKTFLNIVADDLQKRYDNMKDVTIIFPNKRASIFFDQYLFAANNKPMWAPRYTTISEIFHSLSELTTADPILLICHLYDAYVESMSKNSSKEEIYKFDSFYSWGEVMLNDFEDIDNNMADAKSLFFNVRDLEALSSYDYITDEQKQAIAQCFNSFDINNTSELHKRFLVMWNCMLDIYTSFQESLKKDGFAYEGMLKRQVVENIDNIDIPESKYVIVGFNVLNNTEKALFSEIKKRYPDTLFYWDYDETYLKDSTFEAGRFVSENIKLFGNALNGISSSTDIFQNLNKNKSIRFINASTDNAQCRYVNNWIKENVTKDSPLNESAVVLCDERLLQPVLHSIPEKIDDDKPTLLNITMGYPLQETPVASFVLSLFDLQFKGWRKDAVRYLYAEKILRHPFTQMIAKDEAVALLNKFKKNNIVYPKSEEFSICPFLENVFSYCSAPLDVLHHIADILKDISKVMSKNDDNMSTLAVESIFTTWQMINRLAGLVESGKLRFEKPDMITRLLRQIISGGSIAFHGEPAIGIQIMGLLETRNLDFDNILMLSVNEGMLPKSSHNSSFIPYSLRAHYGMTTIEKQTSLYAYYFYRAIQRAHNITLVYNSTTEGLSKGEMSRFMMQLKLEHDKLLSPDSHIEEYALTSESQTPTTPKQFKIDKTAEAIEKIKGRRILSPSMLNTYIDCQLKFYLQYVCGFREEDEVTEEIESSTFGSIFHQSMQNLYQPFEGKGDIQAEDIRRIKSDKVKIETEVRKAFNEILFKKQGDDINTYKPTLNGEQMLNMTTIIEYVNKQLDIDTNLCPMSIIGLEKEKLFKLEYADGQFVTLGGIIDREDIVSKRDENNNIVKRIHRIVDYKTSTKPETASNVGGLFEHKAKRAYHFLQALYYCEVVTQLAETEKLPTAERAISPALVYIKSKEAAESASIKIGKEYIEDYESQCRDEYQAQLISLIREILNPDVPFIQPDVDDNSSCRFCPFKTLCSKDTVKFDFN